MLRKPHIHRPVAVLLMLLGAAMLLLAFETWAGAVVLALGVFVEAAAIAVKHKK